MYYSFALAGHRGTCLRPLHIFALLLLCFKRQDSRLLWHPARKQSRSILTTLKPAWGSEYNRPRHAVSYTWRKPYTPCTASRTSWWLQSSPPSAQGMTGVLQTTHHIQAWRVSYRPHITSRHDGCPTDHTSHPGMTGDLQTTHHIQAWRVTYRPHITNTTTNLVTLPLPPSVLPSLPLHFNSHFPGEPGLATTNN